MIGKLSLALVVAGLAWTAPVAAQDDHYLDPELRTGSHFKQAPETAAEAEAREMQKQVARCVFERNNREVRNLLTHSDMRTIDFDALGQDSATWFDDFQVGDCMGRAMKYGQYKLQMRMPYATLRNLLAEEVYLNDHKLALALQPAAEQTVTDRYGSRFLDSRTAVMTELADCISFNGTAQAHELLRSRPGSKEEAAAFTALSPTLGTCLKSSSAVEIQPSLLRQVVADGMWARGYYAARGTGDAAK